MTRQTARPKSAPVEAPKAAEPEAPATVRRGVAINLGADPTQEAVERAIAEHNRRVREELAR